MTISKNEITIVIPTRNEAPAIGQVIEEARQEGYSNILVVDGHSTDGTFEYAKQSGANVIMQLGNGKCDAIKTAIRHVETPYMLVMSGGRTYDPKDIQTFLSHIENYDLIIGFPDQARDIPRLNRFGSWVIAKIFNFLFRTRLHRVASGFYMLKTEHAKRLTLLSSNFGVDAEIAAETAFKGKLTDVRISYRNRIGEPKVPKLEGAAQIFRDIFGIYNMLSPFDPRVSVMGALATAAIVVSSRILFGLEITLAVTMLSIGAVFVSTWGLEFVARLLKLMLRS
jgi:dolichol-phosphate mannosyltransferase